MSQVIFVDDEAAIREAVRILLKRSGYEVTLCANARECLAAVGGDFPGIVVSDLRMAGMDGLALLQELQGRDRDLPVLLVTAHGDIQQAVDAMRLGAYDFIEKPFSPERLLDSVRRATEKRALALDNRRLRFHVEHKDRLEGRLIGVSPAIKQLRQQVLELARTPANVLLRGETGSGKEQVARCLHDFGTRADAPFVAVNCAAIPEHLFETELFGHESGAFTGAQGKRIGKIEHANGGTLFLDEIESMPLSQQVKLLRVIQERQLERLGSNQIIHLDLRIVSATKPDLRDEVRHGRFREDLLYRLNLAELQLPPLRARREDIMLLFEHFSREAAERLGRSPAAPNAGEFAWLLAYEWPGNVRELANAAERHVLGLTQPVASQAGLADEPSLSEMMEAYEAQCLREALARSHGDVRTVMAMLKLPRRTLNEKMQRHGLARHTFVHDEDSDDTVLHR
jgi:two-component system C4-dicarboxylate transport response regulator DctD